MNPMCLDSEHRCPICGTLLPRATEYGRRDCPMSHDDEPSAA